VTGQITVDVKDLRLFCALCFPVDSWQDSTAKRNLNRKPTILLLLLLSNHRRF